MSNTSVPDSWKGLNVDPQFASTPGVAISDPNRPV